jgi:hypothetical protein
MDRADASHSDAPTRDVVTPTARCRKCRSPLGGLAPTGLRGLRYCPYCGARNPLPNRPLPIVVLVAFALLLAIGALTAS